MTSNFGADRHFKGRRGVTDGCWIMYVLDSLTAQTGAVILMRTCRFPKKHLASRLGKCRFPPGGFGKTQTIPNSTGFMKMDTSVSCETAVFSSKNKNKCLTKRISSDCHHTRVRPFCAPTSESLGLPEDFNNPVIGQCVPSVSRCNVVGGLSSHTDPAGARLR